jgi:phosphatidylglycerol:prolipoprotein diacylglycerol transferase
MTDWHLYVLNPVEALYVWNGGLSMLGALLGVFVGALIAVNQSKGNIRLLEFTDSLAIGIPFGQAIGRLGNWINQELYGAPTNVPWKLFIDPAHRLTGYEKVEYYHPLFAYELLCMVIVGAVLWYFSKKYSFFTLGSGMVSLLYLATYGWIRFFLEFLRVDKIVLGNTLFGVNQLVMLFVAIVATVYIFKKSIVWKFK